MNKKILGYLKHPSIILVSLDSRKIIRVKDEIYLKVLYKSIFNKKLNLKDPQTFNEKLQWLKLYDRNPKYTIMVDKYAVKQYISEIIGEEYVIKTLGVWDKFENIDFDKLPNAFVIKCTHDSGGLVICKDKSKFDIELARKKIEDALKINYFFYNREWPYKNVKPRIIIEEYMKNGNESELKDYKFMCFNGKVKCSFVCSERNSKELKVDFFDLDWNKLPFIRHYPNSNKIIKKPLNYELMVNLAEKLSKGIPFLRVDFYEINGKVFVGELTFYPGSGFEEFKPEEWDKKLGDMLELPKNKLEEKNEK